jgi:3-isopropylmalate/(R)-2-methylmalate dehydratase small subunit
MDYGFRAVMAPDYADIFLSNCYKNELLPVILPELFSNTFARDGYSFSGS